MEILYNKTHEWVTLENNIATIGISKYGQSTLGKIVFVELPHLGKQYNIGDEIVVLESMKAASNLYSPISGKVVEVNSSLSSNPSLINSSPLEDGWLFKMEVTNGDTSHLMPYEEYMNFIKM